jgi:hypothetical protein
VAVGKEIIHASIAEDPGNARADPARALCDDSGRQHGRFTSGQCSARGRALPGDRHLRGRPDDAGAIAIPYPGPLNGLTGTLTITAYTACGGATAGSFDVHSLVRPVRWPQPERPGVRAPGSGAIVFPIFGGTGVLTATGTIAQDTAHPGDPTYLSVTAKVIYGRYGLTCPPICANSGSNARACPAAGCTYTTVVTRTASFGSVTGFLRLQLGQRVMAGLAFLPPPDPTQALAAAAMQVQPIAFVGVHTGA